MRTVLCLAAGFSLLAGALRYWGGSFPQIIPAPRSVAEELPIFLLIFGLPAVAAGVIKWKFL